MIGISYTYQTVICIDIWYNETMKVISWYELVCMCERVMCRKRTITIVCPIYHQQFTYSITLAVFTFQILYRMCLVEICLAGFPFIFLFFFSNHVTQYWTSWMRGEPKLMSDIFSCLFHLPSVTISIRILAAYVLNNILT